MTSHWMVGCLIVAIGAAACSETRPQAAAAHGGAITSLYTSKCSKCHAPPEPQTRGRDELQAAFGRHRERVHLTTAQWAAMLDYLAAPL
jgi:hypothetical protein